MSTNHVLDELERLRREVARLTEDYQRMVRRELDIAMVTAENQQLRTVLAACQKALKEMQAERDRAREGKR